jgi:acyl-CoA dehydrogenase
MSIAPARDQELLTEVKRIADEVAGPNAGDVDKEARFPHEAIDALREAGALSAFVPTELGGGGVAFETIAQACLELGKRCGASAMVYAMHQIQVASIVRHLEGDWFSSFLEDVSRDQILIASVTSEVGTGGDMGKSVAAVETDGDERTIEKQAPTVSYAHHADAYLTTVRRAPDAEPGDQVAVLTRKEQTELEPTGTWDPLGMRGTCSPGCIVRARFAPEQILPTPFPTVSAESMVPISHILWSHLWLGIASDAFERGRSFARASAKKSPGQPTPVAIKLSHVMSDLSLLRAEVNSARDEFLSASAEEGRPRLNTMAAALRYNNLKIVASEQAPKICQGAMGVCGIVGFKNDTPFSIGRHLRDTMSASLMVANERIHTTNASLLLIAKEV